MLDLPYIQPINISNALLSCLSSCLAAAKLRFALNGCHLSQIVNPFGQRPVQLLQYYLSIK